MNYNSHHIGQLVAEMQLEPAETIQSVELEKQQAVSDLCFGARAAFFFIGALAADKIADWLYSVGIM